MAQTITYVITTCDVLSNTTGLIGNVNNIADIISADLFNENFNTCDNIKFS